jgi:hypothetical protein
MPPFMSAGYPELDNHDARASFKPAFSAVRAKFHAAREMSDTLAGKIKK